MLPLPSGPPGLAHGVGDGDDTSATGPGRSNSTGGTTGCPTAGFTVATGKTTTVTFVVTNDVCTITVAGPV